MKSKLLYILLFLALPAFGQNWAPFRFDKKMVFAVPDTLQRIRPKIKSFVNKGKSLYLVKWDTTWQSGDTLNAWSKKRQSPVSLCDIIGNDSESNTPLFARQVRYMNNIVELFDTIRPSVGAPYEKVFTRFELTKTIGDTVLKKYFANDPAAGVLEVIRDTTDYAGQPDSVMVIRLVNTLFPRKILYSRNQGIIQFPYWNKLSSPFADYSLWGNYDDNLLNLAHFPQAMPQLQVYDQFTTSEAYTDWTHNPANWTTYIAPGICNGTLVTNCAQTSVDSVWLQDSLAIGQCPGWPFGSTPQYRYRKIKKTVPTWLPSILSESDYDHQSAIRFAFLDDDSLLFVGAYSEPVGHFGVEGWCTTLPIGFSSHTGAFQGVFSKSENVPLYFSRPPSILGALVPNTFIITSKQLPISGNKETLHISPNPTSNELWISSPEKIRSLSIVNALGKVMKEGVPGSDGKVHVGDLPAGVYLLRWVGIDGGVGIERVLKE